MEDLKSETEVKLKDVNKKKEVMKGWKKERNREVNIFKKVG